MTQALLVGLVLLLAWAAVPGAGAPGAGLARAQTVEVSDGLMRRFAERKEDRLQYWIATTSQKLIKWNQEAERLQTHLSDLARVRSLTDAVRLLSAGGLGYANPQAGALLETYFPPLDSALVKANLLYRQAEHLRSAYTQMLAAVRRQMSDFAAAQAHLSQLAGQAQGVESQQAAFELMNTIRQARAEQLWLWRQLVHLRINARVVQASYETYRQALDRHALRCALNGCEGSGAAPVY